MSNGLNLPFAGTLATDERVVFSVTNPANPPRPTTLHPVIIAVEGNAIKGTGVSGTSQTGLGMSASSNSGTGIEAVSNTGEGVLGQGKNGVHGRSASATDSGVWGENTGGGYGVSGVTQSSFVAGGGGTAGVWGHNRGTGTGVKGTSSSGDGVFGGTVSKDHAGVSAYNGGGGFALWAGSTGGPALWAGGTPAGHFEGDVEVTGDLLLTNADCAEDFDVSGAEGIEPGTVMVIDDTGTLKPSEQPYDKRVAGVVSGAGDCRPGIVLNRQPSQHRRAPVALLGRVHCKVDAQYGSIAMGDLLTTSPTPGHAMRATDPTTAFGTVLGKALRPQAAGQGMIPVLVALQ